MTPQPTGSSFTYEDFSPFSDNPVPMWRLGVPDSIGTPGINVDPQVAATAIREGNFDYVTNEVRWDTSPQTMPDSLYLTAKPAFFGSNPWPWVDPTGTTKLHTLPARARFDAIMAGGTQTLTVAAAGTGTGTVASTPAGINCGTTAPRASLGHGRNVDCGTGFRFELRRMERRMSGNGQLHRHDERRPERDGDLRRGRHV